jgi:RpiB/LacA/LacB family sugar-phosphate isomerase
MKKAPIPARKLVMGGIPVAIGSHAGKTIYVSSDHRGFALKKRLSAALRRKGWRVADMGPRREVPVDYPLTAARAARAVGRTAGTRGVGIGICGSSIGMMIAAAKVRGVHPANPPDMKGARTTRRHNNSNFLALSAERTGFSRALAITLAWLAEPFYADPKADRRYLRRYLETARLER